MDRGNCGYKGEHFGPKGSYAAEEVDVFGESSKLNLLTFADMGVHTDSGVIGKSSDGLQREPYAMPRPRGSKGTLTLLKAGQGHHSYNGG